MLKNGYEIVLQLPVVKYDSILEKPDFFKSSATVIIYGQLFSLGARGSALVSCGSF